MTQVISRVISAFKVSLPLSSLFAAPTVGQMAVVITQHQAKQVNPEEVERLLAELEAMTEAQAKEALGPQRGRESAGRP